MPQAHHWAETLLSREDFIAQLQDESLWESRDGGAREALKDAHDFLRLARQSCPTVVVMQEGYAKLQSGALDRQLPPELRAGAEGGPPCLPPSAKLTWTPSTNLLHPLQLWARELSGHATAHSPQQDCIAPAQPVPFAVVERCKLLDVQYVCKQLYATPQQQQQQQQQQEQQPHAGDVPELPEHERVWGADADGLQEQEQQQQQEPICRRLSFRVLLQRLPAAPLPDEEKVDQDSTGVRDSSSWQQRGLQGAGNTRSQAYTCVLEYPAFTLKSSDYLVPHEVFDRGISSWQALRKGEPFWMMWDDTDCRGFAAGFRQRKHGDPFQGSPWWSIAVEWEGHSTDRKKDPEDWCFANPWEMRREPGNQRPPLPDAQTALAALSKTGHPVLAAPWTKVWAEAMAHAETRRRAKRKRQEAQHDDDFVYFEDQQGLDADEEATAAAADMWDPSEFYYDDDPMDYVLDPDAEEDEEGLSQRRRGSKRQQQSGSRRNRQFKQSLSSPTGDAADGASFGSRGRKAAGAAAAQGDVTHTYGRELLARRGVCVVCGSSEGSLVTGHAGSSGNCARQYHAGCLLLLNAAGIRSVCLARKAKGGSSKASASQHAAAAQALCTGLLEQLIQQSQQPQHGLSPATLQAISAAGEAAAQVAQGRLMLCCPSHSCHGCHLNGKLEFMVWCCCCWLRVYHHRQCVPHGAQHVQMDGKDFIRCPHCTAAGVPVQSSSTARASRRNSSAAGVAGLLAAAAAAATAAEAAPAVGLEALAAAGLTAAAEAMAEAPAASAAGGPAEEAMTGLGHSSSGAAPAPDLAADAALQAGRANSSAVQHADSSQQAGCVETPAAQAEQDTARQGLHAQHLQTLQEQLQALRDLLLAPAAAPEASRGLSNGGAGQEVAASTAAGAKDAGQQQSESAGIAAAAGCEQDSVGEAGQPVVASSAMPDVEFVDLLCSSGDSDGEVHGDKCRQQQAQQGQQLLLQQQGQQNGEQQRPPVQNGKLQQCSMDTSPQQQQQQQQSQHMQELQQQPEHPQPSQQQDPYAAEIAELEARLQVLRQKQRQWREQQQQQTAGEQRQHRQQDTTLCRDEDNQQQQQQQGHVREQQGVEAAGADAGGHAQAALGDAPACPAALGVSAAGVTGREPAEAGAEADAACTLEMLAAAAAAHAEADAADDAAAAEAAADTMEEEPALPQEPTMPVWLQLAIEDSERLQPSFALVPCDADGSEYSTATGVAGSSSAAAELSAAALAAAAAAAGTLPPGAAEAAADAAGGLLLRSPHSHWLIGSLAKAMSQYQPKNMWGVGMIGVPECPDDVVYGLAVVVDFLPALQQRQAQLSLEAPGGSSSAAGCGEEEGAVAAARRGAQRPSVYLRCNRTVARDGRLHPYRGDEEGRRGEWLVLVNGRPYPERQGRKGLQLEAGDVITVQGLSFKLQLAQDG